MTNRKVTKTGDDSNTLYVPELDEHYHSIYGAVQEAQHVFIDAGLNNCGKRKINILEFGFGTGLNAFLSLKHAQKADLQIHYTGVEKYPVKLEEALLMNYPGTEPSDLTHEFFKKMHESPFGEDNRVSDCFILKKIKDDFYNVRLESTFDLIYFDAFGPRVQPDLWEKRMFANLYGLLNPNGILVTYCAKGQVRRDLIACGFKAERLPGPPGKREMLRATK